MSIIQYNIIIHTQIQFGQTDSVPRATLGEINAVASFCYYCCCRCASLPRIFFPFVRSRTDALRLKSSLFVLGTQKSTDRVCIYIYIYTYYVCLCVCVFTTTIIITHYMEVTLSAFGNGNGRSHLYVRITGGDRERGSGRWRRGGEFDAPAAAAISAAAAVAADCRRYNSVIIPVAVFAFAGQFSQFRPSVFAPATHSFTHRPSRVLLSTIAI